MVSLFLLSIFSYSFSNKFAYDTTHINIYSLNLLRRSNSCAIITINYIQLTPLLTLNRVIDVEEALVSLFLLSFCSYSYPKKLAYDTTHTNIYSVNLLERSHPLGIITIMNCIRLPPFSIWNGVIDVQVAMVSLFLLSFCSYYISNKLAYDTTYINNFSQNMLRSSHSCGIITNNYIQLPPLLIWNGVIDVEEALVSLFLLSICSYSFPNKLAYDTTHINNHSLNLAYDTTHINNYYMNFMWRSYSCGIITINYIQLPPLSIWNGVIDVEELNVSLFLLSIYSYSISNKLVMILVI